MLQAEIGNTDPSQFERNNIRTTEENTNKEAAAVAPLLLKVVQYSQNMRLLLLTATPMYNSYKEIVWLSNLMSLNDKRSTIEIKDVFDSSGNFKATSSDQHESGELLLRRKLTGYVSYVRGENPYAFPFRIYPSFFSPEHTLKTYPKFQMNGKEITTSMIEIPVYINPLPIGTYQHNTYRSMIHRLATKETNIPFEDMDGLGYTLLQHPIEALNMVFPTPDGAGGVG